MDYDFKRTIISLRDKTNSKWVYCTDNGELYYSEFPFSFSDIIPGSPLEHFKKWGAVIVDIELDLENLEEVDLEVYYKYKNE